MLFRRVSLRLAGFDDMDGFARIGERPMAGLRRNPLERFSGLRVVFGVSRRTFGDVLGDESLRRGLIVGLGLEALRPLFRLGDTRTPGDVRRLGVGRRVDPICGRRVGEVRPLTPDRLGDCGRASLLPPLRLGRPRRLDLTFDFRDGRVERLMVPPDLRVPLRGEERRGETRLLPDRCVERGAVL